MNALRVITDQWIRWAAMSQTGRHSPFSSPLGEAVLLTGLTFLSAAGKMSLTPRPEEGTSWGRDQSRQKYFWDVNAFKCFQRRFLQAYKIVRTEIFENALMVDSLQSFMQSPRHSSRDIMGLGLQWQILWRIIFSGRAFIASLMVSCSNGQVWHTFGDLSMKCGVSGGGSLRKLKVCFTRLSCSKEDSPSLWTKSFHSSLQ